MTRQTRRTFLATVDAVGFTGCSSVADETPFPADESERETRRSGRIDVTVADDFESLLQYVEKKDVDVITASQLLDG